MFRLAKRRTEKRAPKSDRKRGEVNLILSTLERENSQWNLFFWCQTRKFFHLHWREHLCYPKKTSIMCHKSFYTCSANMPLSLTRSLTAVYSYIREGSSNIDELSVRQFYDSNTQLDHKLTARNWIALSIKHRVRDETHKPSPTFVAAQIPSVSWIKRWEFIILDRKLNAHN